MLFNNSIKDKCSIDALIFRRMLWTACVQFARRLELPNNKLKKLPGQFAWLTELETIDVRHNLFKSLPNTICNLNNLITLEAGENVIKNLPNGINKCEQLVEVRAPYNKIKKPPGKLGTTPNLKTVNIN